MTAAACAGFEHEGQRWQRWWLYYNGVPEELLHFRDIPVPGARVRFYARPDATAHGKAVAAVLVLVHFGSRP